MRKFFDFLAALLFAGCLAAPILSQSTGDTDGDTLRRFEVGFNVTALHQRSYQDDSQIFDIPFPDGNYIRLSDHSQTEYGFGGRLTYNVNKNVAVEGEANFFPVDRLSRTGREAERIFGTNEFFRVFVEPQGRKFQVLAGPKIGYRTRRFGVYAKVRPGLFYVERFPVIRVLSLSPPALASGDEKRVFPSIDVGGVAEFYPSRRTILRFDIGDTIIRYSAQDPREFNPGFTRHTLQLSTSFGFRF